MERSGGERKNYETGRCVVGVGDDVCVDRSVGKKVKSDTKTVDTSATIQRTSIVSSSLKKGRG